MSGTDAGTLRSLWVQLKMNRRHLEEAETKQDRICMHLFLTCIVQQPHHMDAVYHTKAGCVGFGLTDDVCVDCVCSVGICCVSRVTGGVLFRELSWKIPLDMGFI